MNTDSTFRMPVDLTVHPTKLRRVALIGSCLMEAWPSVVASSANVCDVDFFLVNHGFVLPAETPNLDEYDFQVLQIPLRGILRDHIYFNLSYADADAYQRAFEEAKSELLTLLESGMRWNRERGLLTFVMNFLAPQQNPQGRFLPRYDLRNPMYFVEKLNEVLADGVAGYENAHVFDFDQVVASYGRRYFQDDHVWQINHASALSDMDARLDGERLDGPALASETYPSQVFRVIKSAWEEIVGWYRTIQQVDPVKLVIVDLDDTLWRGVAAEQHDVDSSMVEGWPLGVVEALGYLKRRGILLAIVSKNDEETVRPIWTQLFQGRLRLDDFASRKINWVPKVQNIEAVLSETNLLARNTVFIDDNPAERAAVAAAFPDLRVMGGNPLTWRRVLLWAPELQVVSISDESAKRTEMVKAQVAREQERSKVSREEFLSSLGLQVEIAEIVDPADPSFARMFELLNKTNQFNTTGKRWTDPEIRDAFRTGLIAVVARAKDRFTNYGLVSVALVRAGTIEQMVLSCRVVGLDVEAAVVAHALQVIAREDFHEAHANQIPTSANLLSRGLFSRFGFTEGTNGVWRLTPIVIPDLSGHILLSESLRYGSATAKG